MIDKGDPLFLQTRAFADKGPSIFRDNAFYTSTVASVVKTLFDSRKFFTLIAHNTLAVTRSIARFVCDSWDLLWQLRFTPMIYLFIFSHSNLRGRRTQPRGTFARMSECGIILWRRSERGSICICYILRGENLQIVGRFFGFGTFKPYNFRISQDIANLKQMPETTYTREYLCKI